MDNTEKYNIARRRQVYLAFLYKERMKARLHEKFSIHAIKACEEYLNTHPKPVIQLKAHKVEQPDIDAAVFDYLEDRELWA